MTLYGIIQLGDKVVLLLMMKKNMEKEKEKEKRENGDEKNRTPDIYNANVAFYH